MIGGRGSIRTKFVLAVSLAIMVAQVAVAAVAVWQEARLYARSKQETLFAAAEAISAAASRPTAARDSVETFRALRAIGGIPGAAYARVDDMKGAIIAESGQAEQLDSDAIAAERGKDVDPLSLIGARTLEVSVPIVESGVPVGQLVLIGDISDLPARLANVLALTAAGAVGALLLAIVIAMRMLKPMTRPLSDLAGVMSRVRATHDYSISMQSERTDEIGVLVRGFDKMIGDIRQRNEDLARHRDKLEQDVADRTADYRAAMEAAEDANRSKSDFLATMSHEIRTPMNGVLVMAELLAASDLPPGARKNADVIVRSGQTLLAIINDILDFSKIEAGKLDVEHLAVDPVAATEDVMKLFGDRAQSKGLELAEHVRLPRGVRIDADPVRLNQVLSNLVNNAIKFTQRGAVTIEIGPDPQDAARVCFSVVDTGIGIPEDKLDGIFGAFTQADQSTTRKFGGTGLGLAISLKLVAAMGGELRVSSSAGAGARFYFSLPLSPESEPALAPRLQSGEPARAILSVAGAATRGCLALTLENAGFTVDICKPDELTDRAQDARIVFSDADNISRSARLGPANARIVAIAGLGQAPDRLAADRLVDAILHRPLLKSDIDEIVDGVVLGRAIVAKASTASRAKLPHFTNARILVVDDGAVNREVASEALRRLGVTPELAVDGKQAVTFVEQGDFDLVLMDGSMPEMDGYEATRVIRAREAETGRARLKIVALTAHVIGAAADAWRESGMDGVLHKPFTLAALADCLSQHLAGADYVEQVTAPAHAEDGAEKPAVDPAVIAGLREMSDDAAVARIAGLYCAHAPKSVTAIADAFAKGDREALAGAAHALKSMSANIGAVAVAAACQGIERMCRLELRMPEREAIDAVAPLLEAAVADIRRLANLDAAEVRRQA